MCEMVRLWRETKGQQVGISFIPLHTCISSQFQEPHTLNAALYGSPIGRLAKMASNRLAIGERKAKLCEISWIARNRFWFAVAPIMYAVAQNRHEKNDVSRRRYAQQI